MKLKSMAGLFLKLPHAAKKPVRKCSLQSSYIYNAENPQERIDALRAVLRQMSRVLLVAGGQSSDWPTIEPTTYDYFVGIDRGCLHLLEADLPLQLAVGDF